MTTTGDVIRQIETIKCDRQIPPTSEQQETLDRILMAMAGTIEIGGRR
jgi:hypothetical protein